MPRCLEINACKDCLYKFGNYCYHDDIKKPLRIESDCIIQSWCPLPVSPPVMRCMWCGTPTQRGEKGQECPKCGGRPA
jgi:hypothetical protein